MITDLQALLIFFLNRENVRYSPSVEHTHPSYSKFLWDIDSRLDWLWTTQI